MPENPDLVRSIGAAWSRGDYRAVEWAHPEIALVIVGGPVPGGWQGLTGMAEGARAFLGAWKDLRIEIGRCERLGSEHVVARTRTTADGGEGGSERRQLDTNPAVLFQVQDGKVTRLVVYWDGDRALAGLGLEE